jgi:hypothetical protein
MRESCRYLWKFSVPSSVSQLSALMKLEQHLGGSLYRGGSSFAIGVLCAGGLIILKIRAATTAAAKFATK